MMMRTLLSNRHKKEKARHMYETPADLSIKSLRIGQKILNSFHINHISKHKPKINELLKTNRRSQSLRVDLVDGQGLFTIASSSIFPRQYFKPSNASSKFYKRERNQREQNNNESHSPFAYIFASFPVQTRSVAERHRRIRRVRNVIVSERNIDKQRRVKTEYDEQQGDYVDSFIFRPLRANPFSEGEIELEGPPYKLCDTTKQSINLTVDRIRLPKYQSKQSKVVQPFRNAPIVEDVLGPRQHRYSCILKPPQRISYGKYNTNCQQVIKSTKRH